MKTMEQSDAAYQRGDMDEYLRIGKTLPLNALVAKAFKQTYRKLVNAAKRINIKVSVMNPLIWLTEVLYDER